MTRFSQKHYSYISGPGGNGPGGFFGRLVAFVVGLAALVVSLFVGAVVIAVLVGFVLIVGAALALRVWWVKRQMQRHAREHGDLEAEYTVIAEERRRDQGR